MSDLKKILLVDDSKVIHEIVKENLSEKKFEIISAFDGMQAFSKLGNNGADIILLDINLPRKDGFDVCENIKQSAFADIPIIFLTEFGKKENAIKALSLGASDFIYKPFNPVELIIRIGIQLRLKKYQRELESKIGFDIDIQKMIEYSDNLYNPITVIQHCINNIKKNRDDDDKFEKNIENLENAVKRISENLQKIRSQF